MAGRHVATRARHSASRGTWPGTKRFPQASPHQASCIELGVLMTTLLPMPCPQCQSLRGVADFSDDENESLQSLKCGACNHQVHPARGTAFPEDLAA
jgi:hypothetical protein